MWVRRGENRYCVKEVRQDGIVLVNSYGADFEETAERICQAGYFIELAAEESCPVELSMLPVGVPG